MEASMEITKSTRHQKIIGDFGENLICNWLSRSGFEVTIVDHTGIDIVAYHPATKLRLGITVKSRTRTTGKEATSVNVFFNRKGDYEKVIDACQAFACEPWLGIYVEAADYADVYLTSVENYKQNYRSGTGRVIDSWKMNSAYQKRYKKDKLVKHIRIEFQASNWEW
jgi:hypothetical protein